MLFVVDVGVVAVVATVVVWYAIYSKVCVCGVSCRACGVWRVVHDAWYMLHGVWYNILVSYCGLAHTP